METRIAILCLSILLLPMQAGAAALSFNPSLGDINVNDTISVDIVIDGLGAAGPDSLAGFGFDVLFDSSILNFESVVYGSLLGDIDPLAFETDILTDSSVPDVLSLSELSFLFDTELDTLQSASFILATVEFSGASGGSSTLSFGGIDLSDAFGFSLSSTQSTANITVNAGSSNVDEPPAVFLALLSLFGLSYLRRNRLPSFSSEQS